MTKERIRDYQHWWGTLDRPSQMKRESAVMFAYRLGERAFQAGLELGRRTADKRD